MLFWIVLLNDRSSADLLCNSKIAFDDLTTIMTQDKSSAIRLDTLIYKSERSNDGQSVGQIVPDFCNLLHIESASSRGQ